VRCPLFFAVLTLSGAGCASSKVFHAPPPAEGPVGEAFYRLGCGDVLEVTFAEHPRWDSLTSVDVDGRLPLSELGRPRIEGLTVAEAKAKLSGLLECDPAAVNVKLADARAGRIYIVGPEAIQQRSVPYRGPERVVEFLYRVGALKPGSSDYNQVHVLRANVAAGGEPQYFRIDLEAILLDRDDATNMVLRASDQVSVGESHRSRFCRRLPDWVRPTYRALLGMLP